MALALLAIGPAASAQTAGVRDSSFGAPSPDADVTSIAPMADGRLVIAGGFTSLGPTAQTRVARLAIDGARNADFANPDIDAGVVSAVALQSDGKIVVVGSFASVGGAGANRVARLNANGTRDTGFADAGALGGVSIALYAVAVQPNGKVLIAGNFASVGSPLRADVARLNADGTLDTSFENPLVDDGDVRSLDLQPDGKVIIGGTFSSINGAPRSGVARLNSDGSLDTSFADPVITSLGGPPPTVTSVALQTDGKVLVGGSFKSVGGQFRSNVARLLATGAVDPAFAGPPITGGAGFPILTVAPQRDGKALIGGYFTSVDGQPYGRVARLNADGTLDTGFQNPAADSQVNTIALQPDGRALIGGNFGNVGGTTANFVARVFATSPQAAPTGVTATAGNSRVTVRWTAVPGAITGYTVTASPGGATCTTTAATSCAVTGLTNGTAYTFTVAATNTFGTGPSSSATTAVKPRGTAAAASLAVAAPKARVTAKGVIVTSRVTVTGAGRISQTATTGTGRRAVRCRVAKAVNDAGTYTLRCDLGAKGRAALRRQDLKLTLRTVFTPTGADAESVNRTVTVKRRR